MNLFLNEPGILIDENFILPKTLHLCMIRFEGFKAWDMELDMKIKRACAREEREEGARQETAESCRAENSLFSLPWQASCCPSATSGTTALDQAVLPLGSESRPTPDTPEVRRPENEAPLKTSGTTARASSGTTAQAVLPLVTSGTTAP